MTSVIGSENSSLGQAVLKITIVDADPNFSILLENENDISNPIWMLFLPYEAACNKLMNFDFNNLYNVRTKLALLLLDWLGVRSDVQTMHGYLWTSPGMSS